MERDAKNLQPPDCGHPECEAKNKQKLELVDNLLAGTATKEQQQKAGELMHDAFVLVNTLPPELLDAILQSHGQVMVKGFRSDSAMGKVLRSAATMKDQVWPGKGSERPN